MLPDAGVLTSAKKVNKNNDSVHELNEFHELVHKLHELVHE